MHVLCKRLSLMILHLVIFDMFPQQVNYLCSVVPCQKALQSLTSTMLRQAGKIRSEDAESIGQRAPFCPSHIPRTIAIERTTVDVKTMIVQHFHNVQLIFPKRILLSRKASPYVCCSYRLVALLSSHQCCVIIP